MLEHLPLYIPITFVVVVITTLFLFFGVLKNRKDATTIKGNNWILLGLVVWLFLQAGFAFSGVYASSPEAFPPAILLFGILPPIGVISALFALRKGRRFIDSLPLHTLTVLNIIRIPVEIVLYFLYLNGAVPELMTFEGRNFDILAGVTAPFVAYFGFGKRSNSSNLLLIWNCLALLLLLNIVITAFLSAPSPVQKFAFDQPNVAILYFPFSWLPAFIVPVVLFGHLASIWQLRNSNKTYN